MAKYLEINILDFMNLLQLWWIYWYIQDKENVLRQAKLLKGAGITITEDASLKG